MKKIVAGLFVLLILSACSGGSSASVVGQWSLVSYGPPSVQIPAAADVETSIEFNDKGEVTGNVGCNGFGGEYEVEGGSLKFGPIMSTLMFCEGPVGEQETFTLNVLYETAAFELDGDTLTITSADGESSVVLARK